MQKIRLAMPGRQNQIAEAQLLDNGQARKALSFVGTYRMYIVAEKAQILGRI
jgi:hypothetical protein